MDWTQNTILLPPFPRGFHLVTPHILDQTPQISKFDIGMAYFFIRHTSASLTINENASPDVRSDMETFVRKLIPDEFAAFRHVLEGPDDMPAHVKASFFGNSLSIPISQGRLALGTWQGIYLGEHRIHGGRREIIVTINGRASQ